MRPYLLCRIIPCSGATPPAVAPGKVADDEPTDSGDRDYPKCRTALLVDLVKFNGVAGRKSIADSHQFLQLSHHPQSTIN
jgi:hypothetical protein